MSVCLVPSLNTLTHICRKESKKYRQYFEHSENPTYSITKYTRNKVRPITHVFLYQILTIYSQEGKGVFLKEQVPLSIPGGIFNLEFNSDGNILAAACEKKSILIFDPLRRDLVHSLNNAHTGENIVLHVTDC